MTSQKYPCRVSSKSWGGKGDKGKVKEVKKIISSLVLQEKHSSEAIYPRYVLIPNLSQLL